MYEIKTITTKDELKRLFNFLSEVFYNDAIEHNEHYYTMYERYEEMKEQLKVDNEMILYIEKDNKIIAGITGKNMKDNKITIGMIAVNSLERNKGLAKQLLLEFEYRCKKKKITHIDLGARFRACPIYQSLKYNYTLMIQVFDFVTIEEIRRKNKYNFEEISSWQGETYGYIFLKTNEIKKEYIDYFEKEVKTAHAQYIFEKEL